MCEFNDKGCRAGDACRYAHSLAEMQPMFLVSSIDFGIESPDTGFALLRGGSFASTRASESSLTQLSETDRSFISEFTERYCD